MRRELALAGTAFLLAGCGERGRQQSATPPADTTAVSAPAPAPVTATPESTAPAAAPGPAAPEAPLRDAYHTAVVRIIEQGRIEQGSIEQGRGDAA